MNRFMGPRMMTSLVFRNIQYVVLISTRTFWSFPAQTAEYLTKMNLE